MNHHKPSPVQAAAIEPSRPRPFKKKKQPRRHSSDESPAEPLVLDIREAQGRERIKSDPLKNGANHSPVNINVVRFVIDPLASKLLDPDSAFLFRLTLL